MTVMRRGVPHKVVVHWAGLCTWAALVGTITIFGAFK